MRVRPPILLLGVLTASLLVFTGGTLSNDSQQNAAAADAAKPDTTKMNSLQSALTCCPGAAQKVKS